MEGSDRNRHVDSLHVSYSVAMFSRFGSRRRRSKASAAPVVADEDLTLVPLGSDVPGAEVVTTLDQLDAKLREIDAAWEVSDDEVRRIFATFRMEIPIDDEQDPWSDSYREAQFDLYHRISGRPKYTTANEVSGFPVDPTCPFPYYTQSPSTVGDQLIAVGFIIKMMNLPSGSSILEFGPGWGNTTIALSQMGYEVTALDIDPTFVQLIQDRAALLHLNPSVSVGAFLDAGTISQQFDAVLFYECFHHCSDHVQLLQNLHRVVKPGGKVFLASEPIFEGFHAPWGLRLDGESLWAIRQNGWLELGYSESYFVETCLRQGWSVTRYTSEVSHLTSIFALTQTGDVLHPGALRLPPVDEASWAAPDSATSTQRYTSAESRLVCPVGLNSTSITISLVNPAPHDLPYTIRHGEHESSGSIRRGSQKVIHIPYNPLAGSILFRTETWRPSEVIEGSTDGRHIGIGVVEVRMDNNSQTDSL